MAYSSENGIRKIRVLDV